MNTLDEHTLQFVREHRQDDVRGLMLSAQRWPQVDVRQACVQIAAWQRARQKLPSWAANDAIRYPEQLSMEQCSSELTARYKGEVARRHLLASGEGRTEATRRMADLTGGFGVDATMLAQSLSPCRLTFVERSPELCDLARHNLPLLGVDRADVLCTDCEQALARLPRQHLLFLDPARRDQHGGRTYAIADCTPDVARLLTSLRERCDVLMLKLSPMLDLSAALRELQGVGEVHVVSVDGECKELLLIIKGSAASPAQDTTPLAGERGEAYVCVNLSDRHPRQTFVFTHAEERQAACPYTTTLRRYLYEPNASVLKAGAYKCVAQRYSLEKLHPSSHLYTADTLVADFPGRCFEVVASSDFAKRKLKALLAGLSKANLSVRNFPLGVAELRRRLHLGEGGDDYLFATTLADGQHALVRCRKTP